MTKYNKINNILGWFIFLLAAIVYTTTAEQTVSLWDCGEFISGAYKLQVMHPPGAPFFLMLGRLFTLFASPEWVAFSINFLSAISTAFAVLFIFWIITALAKKLVIKNEDYSLENIMVVMGAGIVGALSCTFLDTIWFSAVEGEVYALSTLFICLVFWAALKWERIADEPGADRWLIFIAYMMGISTGVHLMSLLAIPAIALIYYFKKYEPTTKGIIIAMIAGFGALVFIYIGVVSIMIGVISKLDLMLVNGMGMPFNTGFFVFLLALVGAILYGFKYAADKQLEYLHKGLLAVCFIFIGFSSYTMVFIRANAEPAINMNAPGDLFRMNSYLNREQYGDRPLLYGPVYTSQRKSLEEDGTKYYKGEEKYEDGGDRIKEIFDSKDKMLFPRVYSRQGNHINAYMQRLGLKKGEKPKFSDNIRFFVTYQVGFMWFRYFMWNFIGRQNEDQGHYAPYKSGNAASGITPIDNMLAGVSQKDLPASMTETKSRNTLFMLPFILGIIGIVFQYKRDRNQFWIIFILFLFTGIFEIVFFNSPPIEPRERDYTLVGSFITFTIWIGIGVIAIYEFLKKQKLSGVMSAGVATAICLLVPALMAAQEYDDHDRSGHYLTRDMAWNYLQSCPPNAILFTQGDNDTYPLWYAQEVENIRPDVRIINLSLLQIGWYINKLKLKINEADPVPLSIPSEKYVGDKRQFMQFYDNKKMQQNKNYDLKQVIEYITSDDKRAQIPLQNGEFVNYLPVKNVTVPVDKAKVLANGTVALSDSAKVVNKLEMKIKKNTLMLSDLIMLDMIATNDWERPLCFAITVSNDVYTKIGLEDYLQVEGMVYRVVPVKTKVANKYQAGRIATDIMYDNVMNKYKFGGIKNGEFYLGENLMRMVTNLRNNFVRLAQALAAEDRMDEVVLVLDKAVEEIPEKNAAYGLVMLPFTELYYRAGAKEKGAAMAKRLTEIYADNLRYYMSLSKNDQKKFAQDIQQARYVAQNLIQVTTQHSDTETNKEITEKLGKYVQQSGGPQLQ